MLKGLDSEPQLGPETIYDTVGHAALQARAHAGMLHGGTHFSGCGYRAHQGCFKSAVADGRMSGFLTSVDFTKSHHWELRLGGNLMASLYMISAAV